VKLEALMSLVFRPDRFAEFMVLVGSQEPLCEHVSSCKNLGGLNTLFEANVSTFLAASTPQGTERSCQPKPEYRCNSDAVYAGGEYSLVGLSFHLRSSMDAL